MVNERKRRFVNFATKNKKQNNNNNNNKKQKNKPKTKNKTWKFVAYPDLYD